MRSGSVGSQIRSTMLGLVVCALLIGAPSPRRAVANEDDLRGGVLITHAPPTMNFTTHDPPDWCEEYEAGHAIDHHSEQVVRIDTEDDEDPVIWFVLAAWHEEKRVCAVEFGLGSYNRHVFVPTDHQPCGTHWLTLPTTDPPWPQPLSGIAIAWLSQYAPTGNYIPIYYFGGYVYASSGPTTIPLVEDPGPLGPLIGFANCPAYPEVFEATGGALGINTEGVPVAPVVPPSIRACCDESDVCTLLTAEDCAAAGGDWLPDSLQCHNPGTCGLVGACCFGTRLRRCRLLSEIWCQNLTDPEWYPDIVSCEPLPCPAACCVGIDCVLAAESDCLEQGGVYWNQWADCSGKPCQVACCRVDGTCLDLTPHQCASVDGVPHPEWQSCEVADCPIAIGACCFGERGRTGRILTESACRAVSGTWFPGVSESSQIDCASPAPAQRTSWGEIKHLYR